MGSKVRWLALLVILSTFVFGVSSVSAGTTTNLETGITLNYPPEIREDCAATGDTVSVSGLAVYHRVIFVVSEFEGTTKVEIARSAGLTPDGSGNVSYSFNYPAWLDSISVMVQAEVYDGSGQWLPLFMLKGNWSVTCSAPAEACTPGYWKNHHESWVGYTPDQTFGEVFGSGLFDPAITLGQAIRMGGGTKVYRFGVASLLSVAHPEVNFDLSEAEVIALVQAGDGKTLADHFPDGEDVCPL
jgi:hypothetical protein